MRIVFLGVSFAKEFECWISLEGQMCETFKEHKYKEMFSGIRHLGKAKQECLNAFPIKGNVCLHLPIPATILCS